MRIKQSFTNWMRILEQPYLNQSTLFIHSTNHGGQMNYKEHTCYSNIEKRQFHLQNKDLNKSYAIEVGGHISIYRNSSRGQITNNYRAAETGHKGKTQDMLQE
eukprot:9351056-Ditylum_brightwellii.AAC.1